MLYMIVQHRIVEHPNQEGDTSLYCDCNATFELMAETVYGSL